MNMADLKIFTDNIESAALEQIDTLISQPALSDCKIRIMPDVHAGAGCVIGFTANLGEKVIPNVVGVDIGCGMLTIELGSLNINFAELDEAIHKYVPSGFNVHSIATYSIKELKQLYCYDSLKNVDHLCKSLGTLGGGNHFIEIDKDIKDNKYLVIHTGSRNLGKQVADYYQKVAVNNLKDTNIPKNLCYLEGQDRLNYLHDMQMCQQFAIMNRRMIADIICKAMNWTEVNSFETVHNYIELETNMVRKGAISAKCGEKVLIPMNMRDGCIVGIGKGNLDWNCSAPHGAGRVMSRATAKKTLSLQDFENTMTDVYTTSVNQSTIDESPMVYKSAAEIQGLITDTVDIVQIIKPVYNFKSSN